MLRMATGLLTILFATTTYADETFNALDYCTGVSEIARDVMTARQENRPMSQVIPEAAVSMQKWGAKYGIDMDADEAEEGAALIVIAAYEDMIEPTDRHAKQAITEFENSIFKECYENATAELEE